MTTLANEIIEVEEEEESAEQEIHKSMFELFNSKEPVFNNFNQKV